MFLTIDKTRILVYDTIIRAASTASGEEQKSTDAETNLEAEGSVHKTAF